MKVFTFENLNDTLKAKYVILHFRDCQRSVTSQLSNICNVTVHVQDDFFTISGNRSNILSFYRIRVEERKNASAYCQYQVAGNSPFLLTIKHSFFCFNLLSSRILQFSLPWIFQSNHRCLQMEVG